MVSLPVALARQRADPRHVAQAVQRYRRWLQSPARGVSSPMTSSRSEPGRERSSGRGRGSGFTAASQSAPLSTCRADARFKGILSDAGGGDRVAGGGEGVAIATPVDRERLRCMRWRRVFPRWGKSRGTRSLARSRGCRQQGDRTPPRRTSTWATRAHCHGAHAAPPATKAFANKSHRGIKSPLSAQRGGGVSRASVAPWSPRANEPCGTTSSRGPYSPPWGKPRGRFDWSFTRTE